jgi:hypothetical protein
LRFQQDEMPRSNCCTNGGNLAPIASDLLTQFGIAVPATPGFSQVIALLSCACHTINQGCLRRGPSKREKVKSSVTIPCRTLNAPAIDDKAAIAAETCSTSDDG